MVLPGHGAPKKIVIIVTTRVTVDTFVSKFSHYIAGCGHHVTIISDGLSRSTQIIGRGSISHVPVPMKRDPSPLYDLRSIVLLVRELKKINPEVISYATPKASLLGSIASFLLRIPTRIYQLWGLRLETVGGPKQKILAAAESCISLLSTKVLANSATLAKKYRELGLNRGRQVDIIGQGSSHGVDTHWFDRELQIPAIDGKTEAYLSSHIGTVVGFVGRLHPDKGIEALLEAVRTLREKGVALRLLIVGGDEGADLAAFKDVLHNSVIVGNVEDPRPYYKAMDVLVLPSLREGFPNVVLEAASMFVPAIVSDATGAIDSVVDGETGLVVPVQNPELLAESIHLFSTDAHLRESLGRAARVRVEKSFSQEEVWEKTLAYILEIPTSSGKRNNDLS